MDPRRSGQDVVRCSLCTNPAALMHCDVCHVYLCKDCVEKHLSDKSTVHKVVSLKQYLWTICPDHPTKQCELHCVQCDVAICSQCVSSRKHKHHDVVDIMENFKNKKKALERDLRDLENLIFPKYKEAASNIEAERKGLTKNSEEVKIALNKQREVWHKEINAIIHNLQSELNTKDSKNLALLDSQEDEINSQITEISQIIKDLKSLIDSGDVYLVSKYKSQTEQYKTLPSNPRILLPKFQPQKINSEKVVKLFGSFSPLFIETEEQDYILPSSEVELSSQDKPLLDVPNIIKTIDTGYVSLYSVSCLSDEHIWTCGSGDIMKLFNLNGRLLNSVQSISGKRPYDVAVRECGDLVYTDYDDGSVNIFKNTEIQRAIELKGWVWSWKPRGVCVTSCDELLVIMDSYDEKQTKVVRYADSTEKQSIQWDDQGQPFYSIGSSKFLCENRNSDICVADYGAKAVIVVSADGKLRFRYTSPPTSTKGPFDPRGIATDSQARILTADISNHRIHILDRYGHFLRFIDKCSLLYPFGLSVDSSDKLFVAECRTGKVKKIQYC